MQEKSELLPNEQQGQTFPVAKMASHVIFQYNVLAIDDTHNTWTNVIVKMTILGLLGSSDDKEKRGVARPVGPPLRGFRKGEEWKMQCKRMHGDRGRYLVNMGEKCNLMIPWTKPEAFRPMG